MLASAPFRKSSQCDTGACVEVSIGDQVVVRNSVNPQDVATFTLEEWTTFLAGVRLGEFDLNG